MSHASTNRHIQKTNFLLAYDVRCDISEYTVMIFTICSSDHPVSITEKYIWCSRKDISLWGVTGWIMYVLSRLSWQI